MSEPTHENPPGHSLKNWEDLSRNVQDLFKTPPRPAGSRDQQSASFQDILERLWQIDLDPDSSRETPDKEAWYQSFCRINATWNIQFAPPKVSGTPDQENWRNLLNRLEEHQKQPYPQFEIRKPAVKKQRFQWLINQIRYLFHRLVHPYLEQIVEFQNTLFSLQQEYNQIVAQLQNEIILRLLNERQIVFNAEMVRLINQIIQSILFSRQKRFNLIVKELLRHFPATMEQSFEILDRRLDQLVREKSELETLRNSLLEALAAPRPAMTVERPASADESRPSPEPPLLTDIVVDNFYFQFENSFRGSETEIRKKQEKYLPYFIGKTAVVDIGCGRGDFLSLLKRENVPATGVDANAFMADYCRKAGFEVVHDDAFAYLARQADQSLGGIFCSQFIEHFPFRQVFSFLHLCRQKLQPGAFLVIETPNPKSLLVGASTFFRDPSHVQPYHPDTLKFLLEKIGFNDIRIEATSFLFNADRLQPLPVQSTLFSLDPIFVDSLLFNFAWLADYLCSPQDYAAICRT